ncbi:MAG: anhydro-N-acetylmuramic acid kinase [Bdellovibrionia bacterium]
MDNTSIRILGVMTGTSCDGLDAACISIDPDGWEPMWSATAPYPAALRKRVLDAQKPGTKLTSRDWLALERDLGEWYASALSTIIKKRPADQRPDVIANHGQTVAHFPASKRQGMTWQLGDPTRIARATGLTVISGFRNGDMAAGGEGAPLAPGFHLLLASVLDPTKLGIAIHNIGGISNLTYVGPEVIAFDTGPGNCWMDAATELATKGKLKFDRGGKLARQGTVDASAVDATMKNAFFKKAPPKSTGRDDFPFELFKSKTKAKGADLVATATAVTAESIAHAYENFILKKRLPLKAIYITGGGAKNPALMDGLKNYLAPIQVSTLEDAGFDPQLVEAQAFAYFGFLSLLGQPLGGSWTGAQGFGPPGQITPGENWVEVVAALSTYIG